MNLSNFQSELPYPQIEVEKNVAESKLLMPCYAGMASELSAILTYAFQSYITQNHPEISKALECVSIVEMKHHELLGKTIYKLGGYPIMGARNYWNGSFASYTLEPKKFLEQNIIAEESAIINYERTILNLKTESVKMLLERIILDEEIHVKVFRDLIAQLS